MKKFVKFFVYFLTMLSFITKSSIAGVDCWEEYGLTSTPGTSALRQQLSLQGIDYYLVSTQIRTVKADSGTYFTAPYTIYHPPLVGVSGKITDESKPVESFPFEPLNSAMFLQSFTQSHSYGWNVAHIQLSAANYTAFFVHTFCAITSGGDGGSGDAKAAVNYIIKAE